MLRTAQPDALPTEGPRPARVLGGVGVPQYLQAANRVGVASRAATALTTSSATPLVRVPSTWAVTGDGTSGSAPGRTSPVVPSTETTSPPATTVPPAVVKRRAVTSTRRLSAPQMQTPPMLRATTAAWLVLSPRLVSTAWAAIIPGRSSGVVSGRTRNRSAARGTRPLKGQLTLRSVSVMPAALSGTLIVSMSWGCAVSFRALRLPAMATPAPNAVTAPMPVNATPRPMTR